MGKIEVFDAEKEAILHDLYKRGKLTEAFGPEAESTYMDLKNRGLFKLEGFTPKDEPFSGSPESKQMPTMQEMGTAALDIGTEALPGIGMGIGGAIGLASGGPMGGVVGAGVGNYFGNQLEDIANMARGKKENLGFVQTLGESLENAPGDFAEGAAWEMGGQSLFAGAGMAKDAGKWALDKYGKPILNKYGKPMLQKAKGAIKDFIEPWPRLYSKKVQTGPGLMDRATIEEGLSAADRREIAIQLERKGIHLPPHYFADTRIPRSLNWMFENFLPGSNFKKRSQKQIVKGLMQMRREFITRELGLPPPGTATNAKATMDDLYNQVTTAAGGPNVQIPLPNTDKWLMENATLENKPFAKWLEAALNIKRTKQTPKTNAGPWSHIEPGTDEWVQMWKQYSGKPEQEEMLKWMAGSKPIMSTSVDDLKGALSGSWSWKRPNTEAALHNANTRQKAYGRLSEEDAALIESGRNALYEDLAQFDIKEGKRANEALQKAITYTRETGGKSSPGMAAAKKTEFIESLLQKGRRLGEQGEEYFLPYSFSEAWNKPSTKKMLNKLKFTKEEIEQVNLFEKMGRLVNDEIKAVTKSGGETDRLISEMTKTGVGGGGASLAISKALKVPAAVVAVPLGFFQGWGARSLYAPSGTLRNYWLKSIKPRGPSTLGELSKRMVPVTGMKIDEMFKNQVSEFNKRDADAQNP